MMQRRQRHRAAKSRGTDGRVMGHIVDCGDCCIVVRAMHESRQLVWTLNCACGR